MSSLARFYNENGYRMMLLKGYACGLNWPNPKHRPYGDIDIWLFGNQAAADETIRKGERDKSRYITLSSYNI